ncbi:MAG: TIGR04372 family glycosyltransferase [Rhodospirillaceae bacterium]|jgi:putative glycosyltransferase (TIGR04372 family)|nr:TIGR04372 family glycosyltransferase [Rhodospirillaceae bacterium]MBT5013853.1 TIGR04372 family glycosyltransferase [Rhodospirillaceae bacterium]MBT7354938.1 TIGR04372 family glycosyltransferase [Rhodospirillaceae bacterium]
MPLQTPEPFRIVAYVGHQTFGNFLMNQVNLAALAQHIPNSVLGVMYRNDRPYKDFITSLNPNVAATMTLPEDPGYVFPMECLIDESTLLGEQWCSLGLNSPDLFLTTTMLPLDIHTLTGEMPVFGVPNDLIAPLGGELIKHGLDPNRWFICLHMREGNYKYRKMAMDYRDIDPSNYLDMLDQVINQYGGQVVRLGDPSMTPLPEMDGLIDLSKIDGTFALQLFATSRARYFIGCDSGPLSFAKATNVPAARVNSMGISIGGSRDERVLPKRGFVMDDGSILKFDQLHALTEENLPVSALDNTPEQLCEITNYFHDLTKDITGWRDNRIDMSKAKPTPDFSGIEFPIHWTHGNNMGCIFETKSA